MLFQAVSGGGQFVIPDFGREPTPPGLKAQDFEGIWFVGLKPDASTGCGFGSLLFL
jgi:hypothetical protein